ncbi:MAG: WYL domain-containing protein, partial [Gammaproteobacteria bacterium]|nr:WYL domain-containing protein [Gammaproteobacteria bacterium]
MEPSSKLFNDIKWGTLQRLQYIEIMAFYTGVVTRSDVAKAFGISDAAATKDLKYYGQIAPDNLIYKHTVFGFVPGEHFSAMFADLSPTVVLPMIAANMVVAGGPYQNDLIYGISTDSLPLPTRLPNKNVIAQITRAIRHHKKLRVSYSSLTDRDSYSQRVIEPHSLVNTGLRWHVRAYSDDTYDFRDFVLSRFIETECQDMEAESSAQYDEDWSEFISLQLAPHPRLDEQKRASLLIDYDCENGQIEIQVRRALIGYILQRLSVDTTV